MSSKYEGGLVMVQREDEGDNTCVEMAQGLQKRSRKRPELHSPKLRQPGGSRPQEQYLGSLREGLGVESMIGK